MTCQAVSETGQRCRIKTPNHRAHFDGVTWWDNAEFRPPPSKQKPGRKRADRISNQAHDLMTSVAARTKADPVTIREPEPRTWTEETWLLHAEKTLAAFLEARAEPFTTPEHLWPLLHDPLPEVDRRVLSRLVQRALRNGEIVEVGGKRLRDTYYSADGGEFKINKIVPIYQAAGR